MGALEQMKAVRPRSWDKVGGFYSREVGEVIWHRRCARIHGRSRLNDCTDMQRYHQEQLGAYLALIKSGTAIAHLDRVMRQISRGAIAA